MITTEDSHNESFRASNKITREILKDTNSLGKNRQWVPRKKQSLAVARAFAAAPEYEGTADERMTKCGDQLRFGVYRESGTQNEKKKLRQANFCRQRLCPMCQWRRSVMLHRQVCQVVEEHVARSPKARVLMLTLTLPNCAPDELNATISRMSAGFRRLSDTADFKRSVVGWFRALEITRNKDTGDYHPHLHVLLAVADGYFSKKRDLYKDTRDWVALWRKAMRLEFDPVCDVRRVGKSQDGDFVTAMRKGLLEVTKYCTKPDSWIEYLDDGEYWVDPKVVYELHQGLKHKRLVGWGGILKELFAELQLEDVENEDADLVGAELVPEGWELVGFEVYGWRNGSRNYYLLRREGAPVEHVPKAA